MRRWLLAVFLVIAACKKPVKLTADQIRSDVMASVKPFLDRPYYAVTDADIVDPCIADAVAQPTSKTAAVSKASMCIDTKLGTPDGLARIEKKIAAHYANPTITRSGDKVSIDAGAPAGTIRIAVNRPVIDSPHIEDGEWVTGEVVRFLKLGMDRYPDARSYEVTVLIPHRYNSPEWRYRYNRGEDRLEVVSGKSGAPTYVSGTIGGDITKLASARTRDLSPGTR